MQFGKRHFDLKDWTLSHYHTIERKWISFEIM